MLSYITFNYIIVVEINIIKHINIKNYIKNQFKQIIFTLFIYIHLNFL